MVTGQVTGFGQKRRGCLRDKEDKSDLIADT
jgi:hypothetical protein